MLAISTLFAALVSFAVSSSAAPSPQLGSTFAVYPGWDMDNGNFETIYNITELACMRTCSADNGCVAYAMDPYGSIRTPGPACFLKNSVNLTSFTMQIDDVSVGLIGQCGTFKPVGPTSCYTVTTEFGR